MMTDFTVSEIVSCYEMTSARAGSFNKNDGRATCGLILKYRGKTEYIKDDKKYICDAFHPIVIGKGAKYVWHCIEIGASLIINFNADIKSDIYQLPKIAENDSFVRIFKAIEHSLSQNREYATLECKKLLYEILLSIAKQGESVPSNKQNMLRPALEYISENYKSKIDNDTLAKLCKMSTVYFRKTFSNVYKTSPIEYVQKYRINKAKEMLSGDYGSICDVADELGFSSIYHFSKTFKKLAGVSPSEYAKSNSLLQP